MLELAVLGLLKERAMHGYELKRQLGQRLGIFWSVSFGSLYPTLKKLHRRRLVEKILDPEETTRRRQVYRITPEGEREFLELIADGAHTAWEEDKFPLRMAFFRYLKPEVRIRVLERRRAYLEEKLSEGRASLKRARGSRPDYYTLSLMRHGMDVCQADLHWIDELIAAERAGFEPGQSFPYADDLESPEPEASAAEPDPEPEPDALPTRTV